MGKITKRLSAVILAIVLAASLAGCRTSPALIDPVYTADAPEIDPDYTGVEFTDDVDAEHDPNTPQTHEVDEAEDYNTEKNKSDAIQDAQADNNTPSRQTGDNVSKNEQLKKGGNSGNGESDSDGAKGDEPQNGNGGGTQEEPDEEEEKPSDDPEKPSDDPENPEGEKKPGEYKIKDGPKRVVTDGEGNEQLIPEDVYTVTAVGAAAPIVAMVGGVERLVGTSESFVSNEIGSMILADAQVNVWWSGDGSGQISAENFAKLLEASPDVCFEISGEATFSSEQIAQLAEYGIGYVPLYPLSSSENLKQDVGIVAKALETNKSTGQSASVIAQSYSDWVDEVLSYADKNRKSLDYYSIYISEWREDVSFSRRFDPGYDGEGFIVDFPASSGVVNGTGQGVAIASTDVEGEPIFEFWRAAGVKNTAVDTEMVFNYLYYAQELGYTGMYIFPYENKFGTPTFSNSSYYYTTDTLPVLGKNIEGLINFSVSLTSGLYWPNTPIYLCKDGSKSLGGSERFPAIVVADDDVRTRISNSPQWKAGFLEDAYDIAGDYAIYVNPTGLNNWAEGSVESPLEAYWVLNKISGAINEQKLKTEVKNFYSKFFGITLSDSQIDNMINK